MAAVPVFATIGDEKEKIDVRLSYRIVRLFSEGLYASPHKAIEELVANSFDAGAHSVGVFLPSDFHDPGATIAVVDDGEGMDAKGLKQHWLIGKSNKRDLGTLPAGRVQIGKFGIGKLATYVLANRLSHVSKRGGKYYATSMDFRNVDERGEEEIEPRSSVKIPLRELSEEEAKAALKEWIDTPAFKKAGIQLFGKQARPAWTFAILSDLKDKVHEIKRGVLEWVLRTALPLRDDFSIGLDGKRLESSKTSKGRIKKWTLGKDITELPKPSPDDLTLMEDVNQPTDSPTRFGFSHPRVGRITGYAEAYRELLTGKSDEIARSHGFFVYVLGRLINVQDGHFGISPDELQHGAFGRMRVVVNMDGLDEFLQSDRERIRQGPVLEDAQNILRGIFYKIRAAMKKEDEAEEPGTRLARKLASSPTSVARRPIVEMARAVLDGKFRSRYIATPPSTTPAERDALLAQLEERIEQPERFVTGLEFAYGAIADDRIAVYDIVSGKLRVNGLHPFVGAFFDEFTGRESGLPLEVFAMAEVLLESQLHEVGLAETDIDAVMLNRDQLLRYAARESGRMTPLMVANALRNAKNNQQQLEIWVVEAFRSLGFEATRLGGPKRADGVAEALLGPDKDGKPQRYKVSLEAKSKEKAGAVVSAKTVGISTVARHREDLDAEHAIVVGQLFPTSKEATALAKEIAENRRLTAAENKLRTITLIHIDDLANLVQHRPVKALTLQRIRAMLRDNSLPEQTKQWVDAVMAEKPVQHDYATIVRTIAKLQSDDRKEPVQIAELRAELRHGTPKIDYPDMAELHAVCERMAGLAPEEVEVTATTVSLNQGVPNILEKLKLATKEHLAKD